MASSLSWLDHDAAASERSMRMLEFFRESEARDELGIGGIRDSISDQLFPGTSTIQTRLRYFFFIPWVFSQLEGKKLSAAEFAGEAKKAEATLGKALADTEGEGVTGIIGRNAGSLLKRMPSSVYWAGLGEWSIRNFDGSIQQYFGEAQRRIGVRAARRRNDDGEYSEGDASGASWDASLLRLKPPDFPAGAQLALTYDEANFLLERWETTQPDTLLTWMARDLRHRKAPPDAERIWEHPLYAEFPEPMRILVDNARALDAVVRGAAYLYNLMLAELESERRPGLAGEYAEELARWSEEELHGARNWNLAEFWPLVLGKGHSITPATRTFVGEWLRLSVAEGKSIANSQSARNLIRMRERELKKGRSRFDNAAARKQWGGSAGTAPLNFRWPIAKGYLQEWHAAWRRG